MRVTGFAVLRAPANCLAVDSFGVPACVLGGPCPFGAGIGHGLDALLGELEVHPVLQRSVMDIVPGEVALEVVTLLWGKVGCTLTETDVARLPYAFRVSAFGGWFFPASSGGAL